MNQVGIRNFVGVGRMNLFPFAGVTVELLGNLAQTIALLDGVRYPRAGRSRRTSASDIGEVSGTAAATRGSGADVGEIGIFWIGH